MSQNYLYLLSESKSDDSSLIATPPSPPSPFLCEGRDWIFELNKIQGELKFFKINAGRKRGEKGEFLKFSSGKGGDCRRWNFKQKTKFQNKFKNVFMSYIINLLKQLFFLIVLSLQVAAVLLIGSILRFAHHEEIVWNLNILRLHSC